ncbi:MAG: methionine biosynthesis protein MetW [Actinobacteria bacterium]|nr:methionine biosynthesis protein MetW [Actinomycetota bacterium]MBU1944185.1 methionine biosynthesis protein MetW [Actinomycetota bacterium]MBU2687504.1 methionine biosynthesis protein MetW [Actinomycetota bacterium]
MKGDIADAVRNEIIDWVEPGSSVLELGCGRGDLLARLVTEKGVRAQGVEIDAEAIFPCIEKGLNVVHEDADDALRDYGDGAFDYTIFDESLQRVVRRPDLVLQEALRVSRRVIVGFSNFAHYRARLQMLLRGRTPVTRSLPFAWYDTPNLHFLSINDFRDYCASREMVIEAATFFGRNSTVRSWPNLRALTGFFLVSKGLPEITARALVNDTESAAAGGVSTVRRRTARGRVI